MQSSTRCTSADSTTRTGDGDGDLVGLTSKLDYLQDLGVDCLWLMPIYALTVEGRRLRHRRLPPIHPTIGTVDDFEVLTRAAHARGIRIIADLVVNHTSDQHPWFQEARRDPNSPKRDYYVWSDTDQKYKATRGSSSETPRHRTGPGIPLARQYYWHRFFSHQPDLNYDNPKVRQEMLDIMAFWLDRGIDGFRVERRPLPVRARGDQLREPARDARFPQGDAPVRRRRATRAPCCWPRRTSGPATCSPTSATATSSTWPSTSP